MTSTKLQWSENEHGEHVSDAGGYSISKGTTAPDVYVWRVYVGGPESIDPAGEPFVTYRGRRSTLDEAKAFAENDYAERYAF